MFCKTPVAGLTTYVAELISVLLNSTTSRGNSSTIAGHRCVPTHKL